ncbi:hypothetical protein [Sulfurimonas sp.]
MNKQTTLLERLSQKVEEILQHYSTLKVENATLRKEINILEEQVDVKDKKIEKLVEENSMKDLEIEEVVNKIESMLG